MVTKYIIFLKMKYKGCLSIGKNTIKYEKIKKCKNTLDFLLREKKI